MGAVGIEDAPGMAKYGLNFDGVNQSVNCGASPYFQEAAVAFSFACWFYTNPADWNATFDVVADTSGGNPGPNDGFFILLDDRGGINGLECVYVGVASVVNSYDAWQSTNHSVSTEGWYHLAVTYGSEDPTSRIYLNGSEDTAVMRNDGSGNFTPRNAAMTLATSSAGGPFTGRLDEVCGWKRVLTALEIADLYNSGYGYRVDPAEDFPSSGTPISTDLCFIYHMNEGSGNTTSDSSGNGYTATLVNSPTWDRFGMVPDAAETVIRVPVSVTGGVIDSGINCF